jgi:hypothetical protein
VGPDKKSNPWPRVSTVSGLSPTVFFSPVPQMTVGREICCPRLVPCVRGSWLRWGSPIFEENDLEVDFLGWEVLWTQNRMRFHIKVCLSLGLGTLWNSLGACGSSGQSCEALLWLELYKEGGTSRGLGFTPVCNDSNDDQLLERQ